MLIIRYSITLRNKKLKSPRWYGRIRQDGREKFLPMDSRQEAERWLNEQKYRYGEYTAGVLKENEILTIDSTGVLARKQASNPIPANAVVCKKLANQSPLLDTNGARTDIAQDAVHPTIPLPTLPC